MKYKRGDWYIPSAGEIQFIAYNLYAIQAGILKARDYINTELRYYIPNVLGIDMWGSFDGITNIENMLIYQLDEYWTSTIAYKNILYYLSYLRGALL